MKNDFGHWTYKGNKSPDDYFGFVYCITNTVTQQLYVGKKQIRHGGKKRSATYGKEMAWRSYVGSSIHVKDDIKLLGKSNFKFEIVDFYKTKGGLYYAEAYTQMIAGSMTAYLADGVKPRFYNRQIAAIRFVPKEDVSPENRAFINRIKKEYKLA